MTTRPKRVAQTSVEVKKDFKKNASRMREDEARRLQRGVELEQRAARLRKQGEQRRIKKQKREQKERKEREARQQLGIGLATQMVGYSRTQKQMKSGMEAFLGLKKPKTSGSNKLDSTGTSRNMAPGVGKREEKVRLEDSDEEDFGLGDLPDLDPGGDDSLIDDDLDDQALVAMEEAPITASLLLKGHHAPSYAAATTEVKPVPPEKTEFVRVHGPVNKALEQALTQLPTPLFEFLSIDRSVDTTKWSPPSLLLYKLNPLGVPPHRLRLKEGCMVSAVRDIETSGYQLSQGTLLRVLGIGQESLECLVLDGELHGRKTSIIRVASCAQYQNKSERTFERLQFPIRVCTGTTTSKTLPDTPGRAQVQLPLNQPPPRPSGKATAFGTPRPRKSCLPVFKLPGLPASKLPKTPLVPEPTPNVASLDQFEDYFESGTQIARELCETSPYRRTPNKAAANSNPVTPGGRPKQVRASAASGPSSHITPDQRSPFSRSSAKYHSTIITTGPSKPSHCLGEFGLSTQDMISFFDDDDP